MSNLVVLKFSTPEGAQQGLELAAHLQKECGFSNSRIAADQCQGTRHDSSAEHPKPQRELEVTAERKLWVQDDVQEDRNATSEQPRRHRP